MKLNRTQLNISGILLMAALILAIYFSRRPAGPGAEADSAPKSIRELLVEPVNIRTAVEKKPATLPSPCPGLFARVTEGTIEDFQAFTETDKNDLQSCSDALPFLAKHDPLHLSRLRSGCSTPDDEGSNAMQNNCALYFYLYKAGLVAFFQKDKALSDLSTEALAQIFFHEYNNLDPQRLDTLSGLADELLRRTPSYSVKKAKASIELFQFMKSQNPSEGEALLRTLAVLKDQNPHDEQGLELHFVALAIMNKTDDMNKLTDEFVQSHPSSAAGHYMRSAYFWQMKDREKTIEALKNAVALEPTNRTYMDIRDRVQTAEPGAAGVYNINVNFDLISE